MARIDRLDVRCGHPRAYARLGRRYGVGEREPHQVFERIKKGAGLPPRSRTLVDDEGNVDGETTGEWIGNLIDEL